MKCQYIVYHQEGFLGYKERCEFSAKYQILTSPERVNVSVCSRHFSFISHRDSINMHSPLIWFIQDKTI